MNNYPEYVEVNGKKYKINTNFKYAIKCNQIAKDKTISDYERALGIVITLFGEESVDDINNISDLLDLAKKYLSCGKEITNSDEEPDMDYEEDYGYIWASMYSDYNGLDIDKEDIHWWKFNELMNGLSNSEFGNCCILNRIRNLRNYNLSEIKDLKEREKIKKAQDSVALKKNKKELNLTNEQEESMKRFNEMVGL